MKGWPCRAVADSAFALPMEKHTSKIFAEDPLKGIVTCGVASGSQTSDLRPKSNIFMRQRCWPQRCSARGTPSAQTSQPSFVTKPGPSRTRAAGAGLGMHQVKQCVKQCQPSITRSSLMTMTTMMSTHPIACQMPPALQLPADDGEQTYRA